jgi:hypothetical protein
MAIPLYLVFYFVIVPVIWNACYCLGTLLEVSSSLNRFGRKTLNGPLLFCLGCIVSVCILLVPWAMLVVCLNTTPAAVVQEKLR